MGHARGTSRKVCALALVAALMWSLVTPAVAGPSGGEIVKGEGRIDVGPDRVSVHQATDRLIVEWDSFSVGPSERVEFHQPGSTSAVLNRVLGSDPSEILGALTANGYVFLVNPRGVLFGGGAQVDVGGLVASTLSLSNEDFWAGEYGFVNDGDAAAIRNQGFLQAADGGLIALIAPQITNEGSVVARLGTVAFGAGDRVTLDLKGNGTAQLSVDEATLAALIKNHGVLVADGGFVLLSAQAKDAIADSVINNDGIVRAQSLEEQNGVIVLSGGETGRVTVSGGTLDVSGAPSADTGGGRIEVTGREVAIEGDARLDASGYYGGVILVGGDVQGGNPDVPHAQKAFVGPDAVLDVSALGAGNGGTAVVWSDDLTVFAGTILARGGATGGDGGFVETSGRTLSVTGHVDASAPAGSGGTWLLDPYNIRIVSNLESGMSGGPDWVSGQDTSYLLNTSIVSSLNGGTSVTVTTGEGGSEQGNIVVEADIQKTAGGDASLRLNAHNRIEVRPNVEISSTSGALDVIFNADMDRTGGGGIVMYSGSRILTNGGNITFGGGADVDAPVTGRAIGNGGTDDGIYLDEATLNAGAGTIRLLGRGGFLGGYGISAREAILLTTSGQIILDGLGSTANGGRGVHLSDTIVSSESGSITVTGESLDTTWYSTYGVYAHSSSISTASAGTIAIVGTSGQGSDDNVGVYLIGTVIETVDGALGVTGSSQGVVGEGNIGVFAEGNTRIRSLGAGEVNVLGAAGDGDGWNTGVELNQSWVTVVNGDMAITGHGGTGINSYGIDLRGGIVRATSGGNVTLDGRGVAGNGVAFTPGGGSSEISAVTGDLTIIAHTQTGTDSINLSAGGGEISGQGNLYLRPLNPDTTIGLVHGDGVFNLSDLDLGRIQDGFAHVVIGHENGTGKITLTGTAIDASSRFRDDLTLRNPGAGSAGIALNLPLNMGSNNLTLHSGGTVTQSQAIAATVLTLNGTDGNFELGNLNNVVATLIGNTGNVAFRNHGAFDVGGVTTSGGLTLTVVGEHAVTQSGVIHADALALHGASATFSFGALNNDVSALTVDAAALAFKNVGDFNVSGLSTSGDASLEVVGPGEVTQSGTIAADQLTLAGSDATFTLGLDNDVATLAGSAREIAFTNPDSFVIAGLATSANTTLTSARAVTQTGSITADTLALHGAEGVYTLDHADNTVSFLAGATGSIVFSNSGSFEVAGIDADGEVQLSAAGAAQVVQSGSIRAESLRLLGSDATYIFEHEHNDAETLSGQVTAATFRDGNGFDVAGFAASEILILVTSNVGNVTQSDSISAGTLALNAPGGTYTFNHAGNSVSVLTGAAGTLSLTDQDGFTVDSFAADGDVTFTLVHQGTVDQSGAIEAAALTLLGDDATYELQTVNNSVTSLGGAAVTILFRNDGDFSVAETTVSDTLTLITGGTVNAIGAISADALHLDAAGAMLDFDVDGLNHTLNTLSGSVGALALRADAGFDIAGLNAGAGGSVTLVTGADGEVTQSAAIVAGNLALYGADGTYTLTDATNAVLSLRGETGQVAFYSSAAFDVSGLHATGDVSLLMAGAGTVSQSAGITAKTLELLGANAIYTFLDEQNDVTTLTGDVAQVAFRDDSGFDVAGLTASGDITLTTGNGATVTQSGVIAADTLTLSGAGGTYSFGDLANEITTLTGSTGSVSLANADSFVVAGLTAVGDVTLKVTEAGEVTQTGAISAEALSLLGDDTTFTLDTHNNSVATLSGTAVAISLRNDGHFEVAETTVEEGLTLVTSGVVHATGAITAGTLNLDAAGADLDFDTGGISHTLTTLTGTVGDLRLRADGGFQIAGLDAGEHGSVTFAIGAHGEVTQRGSLTAGTLTLNGVNGAEGVYTLSDAANDVAYLGGAAGSITFTNSTEFTVTGIDATGNVRLEMVGVGAVGQTGAITAATLELLGADAVYTLTDAGNDVTTLKGDAAEVSFRDDSGFRVDGLTTSGGVTFVTSGTVDQSGAIAAETLTLDGVDGVYVLDLGNAVSTLTGSTGSVTFTNTDGFTVGGLTATGDVTLEMTGPGTVTQTAGISAAGLTLSGDAATYTLNTHNNAVSSLGGSAVAISFRNDGDFDVAATSVDAGLSLTTSGTVRATGAISAETLLLDAAGATLDFDPGDISHTLTTLSGAVGNLSLRADAGFTIGAAGLNAGIDGDVALRIGAAGNVTQNGAITANTLALDGVNGAVGVYVLDHAANNVSEISGTTGSITFANQGVFAVAGIDAAGDVSLTTTGAGTVTQSERIQAATLALMGEHAVFEFGHTGNDIHMLTGTVAGLELYDADGFTVDGLDAGAGGSVTFEIGADGQVDQRGVIATHTLALYGGGTFELDGATNAVSVLTGQTGELRFTNGNGFAVAGLDAAGDVTFTMTGDGAVTQSDAINAERLTLLGGDAAYTFADAGNDVTTLTGDAAAITFRDDHGFEIGGLTTSGDVTLITSGEVTQTGVVTAAQLTLHGDGGTYSLGDLTNDVAVLAGSTGTIAYTNQGGFRVDDLTASGDVTLALTGAGTVTQGGAISAGALTLLGDSATFTLDTHNNAVATLGGSGVAISFRNDGHFDVAEITVDAELALTTGGNVRSTGAISADTLRLDAVGATLDFDPGDISHTLMTLTGTVGTLSLRADAGFTIGAAGLDVGSGGSVALRIGSGGEVTQTGAVAAGTLSLGGVNGFEGTYTLDHTGNDVAVLSGSTGSVTFANQGLFTVAGIVAADDVSLRTAGAGAVTQTGAIRATTLELEGHDTTFEFSHTGNDITSLGGTVAGLVLYDADGFVITGLDAGGTGSLTFEVAADGEVTQTGAIVADSLNLYGAGGSYDLGDPANDVSLLAAETGSLTFANQKAFTLAGVEVVGDLSLTMAGNGVVGQSARLVADTLTLSGDDATYQLDHAENDVRSLTGALAGLTLVDADGFTVGGLDAGATGAVTFVIGDGGTVTHTAAIIAGSLTLNGAGGAYALGDHANQVSTLSGSTGSVQFRNDTSFAIAGLDASGDVQLALTGAGTVDQSDALRANHLTLVGSDAVFTLDHTANNIAALTATLAGLEFYETDGFQVHEVQATGDVTFVTTAAGTVTQTGAVQADTLTLRGAGGTYDLASVDNDVLRLAGETGAVHFRDDHGFEIAGLTATGDVTLRTAGRVTQSGGLVAGGLALVGDEATFTLTHADNAVGTLAGTVGSLVYSQSGALVVGAVGGLAGLHATDSVLVRTTDDAADLTLDEPVFAGGTNNALVLAAGGNFINNAGAEAISVPDGRFLVYSTDPFASDLGGFASLGNLFARTFDADGPESISPLFGSRMIYQASPTLTVTATSLDREYGEANPEFTFGVSGLVDGDTDETAVGGAPATLADLTSNVGDYPINVGTIESLLGYTIDFVEGVLTITPALLTVTADDATREYGEPDPLFTPSFSGFKNDDGPSVVNGLLFATPATIASHVGQYAITPGGASATNYVFAYVDGTLTITPAPLTVRATDAARIFGTPNPAFSVTYSGFKVGDDESSLTGELGFDTAATPVSWPGTYAVTPKGLSSPYGNYVITFVDGQLTIERPKDEPRLPGEPERAFSGSVHSGNDSGRDAIRELQLSLPDTGGGADITVETGDGTADSSTPDDGGAGVQVDEDDEDGSGSR